MTSSLQTPIKYFSKAWKENPNAIEDLINAVRAGKVHVEFDEEEHYRVGEFLHGYTGVRQPKYGENDADKR